MDDLIDRKELGAAIDNWLAIDRYYHPYSKQKTIPVSELVDIIKLLPSAQPNLQPTCNQLATDCISRQAAIDIERNATVDTNPSHFEAHQKFTQFMDDAEVSSFGRWQWSNGFNTALTAVGIDLKKLPSAQPERRGKWQITDAYPHNVYCSECHTRFAQTHWAVWEDGSLPRNFCPKCGALMKGEDDE